MSLPIDLFETDTSGAKVKSYKDGMTTQNIELIATGVEYADTVESMIDLLIPTTTGTNPPLRRDSVSIEPITTDVWKATLGYSSDVSATNGFTFSGTTSGGSSKVTAGLAVTSYGTSPPNMNGAINVTANGVEGVDIIIPALEFQLSKRHSQGFISLAYVLSLMNATGTTNSTGFNGFAAGELLFLGADFSQASEGETEVTYKFVASPNQTGLSFGSITGVAKKGHEYLWVMYEAFEDTTNKAVVRKPRAVYVHRVYRESNFATLGI